MSTNARTRRNRRRPTKYTVKRKIKTYITHDNRGRPFKVEIDGNKATIYNKSTDKKIKSYTFKKIFVGRAVRGDDMYMSYPNNPRKAAREGNGNSLLLYLGSNRYVFIGHMIFEFKTKDLITEFYSMIGRNDVPYPVALGKENIYFMLEDVYANRKHFDGFPREHSWALDSYSKLWGINGMEKLDKDHRKKIHNIRVIHGRVL